MAGKNDFYAYLAAKGLAPHPVALADVVAYAPVAGPSPNATGYVDPSYQMQFSSTVGSRATNPQTIPHAEYTNGAGQAVNVPYITYPNDPTQHGYDAAGRRIDRGRAMGVVVDPAYQKQVSGSVGGHDFYDWGYNAPSWFNGHMPYETIQDGDFAGMTYQQAADALNLGGRGLDSARGAVLTNGVNSAPFPGSNGGPAYYGTYGHLGGPGYDPSIAELMAMKPGDDLWRTLVDYGMSDFERRMMIDRARGYVPASGVPKKQIGGGGSPTRE